MSRLGTVGVLGHATSRSDRSVADTTARRLDLPTAISDTTVEMGTISFAGVGDPGTLGGPYGCRAGPPHSARNANVASSGAARASTTGDTAMRRRASLSAALVSSLVLLLIMGMPARSATKHPTRRKHAAPAAKTASASYPGFGFRTTGGTGHPVFTVTTLDDSGPGSLRSALSKADRDGGTIRFAVGGEVALLSGLDVPDRTTIDGSSAPAPGITLLGERAGAGGTGVLNLYRGNVVVRGLRIRNAMNDGIHIVPRSGAAIANIVVDHCSITGSHDGGIDITGRNGIQVTDVTIVSNYLAGNGGPCGKGMCGGASLAKYGVTRLSYYFNFWDKNLRRTPSISGEDVVADVRYNVVRDPVQGGMQIRDGARANLVGNVLLGPKATVAAKLWGGHAYVRDTRSDLGEGGDLKQPLAVPRPPAARTAAAVTREAGAMPRDKLDTYYVDVATALEQVSAKIPAK